MKINTNKENFLEGIQIIQASVSSRTTLPILHNFLMETEGVKLKTVRTDLEMAATHYIKAEIQEEGSVTIPAKEFSDILHTLPNNSDISLYSDSANKVYITCGKSKFCVIGTTKEEYPIIPTIDKSNVIKISASVLQEMIQKTIFAASTQETRYVLNGLLWVSSPSGFEMVATDGRRLALAKHKPIKGAKDFKIIVPTKILQEIMRFLGSNKPETDEAITIGIASNQIGFMMRDTTYISRLIEGNFPNYEQVIPSKKELIFEVDSAELLAVTKRAALCTSDRGGAVKYQMSSGTLMVSASSQKIEFNDELKTSYKGEDFQTSFNPQYVIDVLKNISAEKAVFSLTNSVNPVVIEPFGATEYKYVVMPIRA